MFVSTQSYLFQMMAARLMNWAREALKAAKKATVVENLALVGNVVPPGRVVKWATVGMDVNTFVGYSLFALKKKYGIIEELAPGYEYEDKYWLLTDMVAKEKDIMDSESYVKEYYDSYFLVFNRGDRTLIAPRYAKLFHGILYQISKLLSVEEMIEEKTEFMLKARQETRIHLPAWAKKLEVLAGGRGAHGEPGEGLQGIDGRNCC